jgi:hypothetical protein
MGLWVWKWVYGSPMGHETGLLGPADDLTQRRKSSSKTRHRHAYFDVEFKFFNLNSQNQLQAPKFYRTRFAHELGPRERLPLVISEEGELKGFLRRIEGVLGAGAGSDPKRVLGRSPAYLF